MKALKFFLGSIYPVLIILLLLNNTRSCNGSQDIGDHATAQENPLDTLNIIEHAEQTGRSGNLKVTLLWNFEGDIDLHVKQPNGKEIYYKRKNDEVTGGALDVDNQDGGNGSAENIFFPEPPKGEYVVSLVYFKGSRSTGVVGSGTCQVVVFQEGKDPQTYTSQMSKVHECKEIVKLIVE